MIFLLGNLLFPMPHLDPDKRREANHASYMRRRDKILARKRELQQTPEFKEKRKAYLSNKEVRKKRLAAENIRYATDPEFREKKKAQSARFRETPEGKCKNVEAARRWRKDNIQACRKYQRDYMRMRRNEPQFRVAENMRGRLWSALNKQHAAKDTTTFKLVGCSVCELMAHLEHQFERGMKWENYGEWHVDHVRPLCEFDLTDKTQQKEAFHFSNLRPLWAVDNLKRPRKPNLPRKRL